jgi:hypothetical protein
MERPTMACSGAGYAARVPGSQRRAAYKEVGHAGVYYHHRLRSARRFPDGGGVAPTRRQARVLDTGLSISLRRHEAL